MCPTCGTSLADVPAQSNRAARSQKAPGYDRRYGETDLYEGETRRSGELVLMVVGIAFLAILCVGTLVFALPRLNGTQSDNLSTPSAVANTPDPNAILITNTARPTSPVMMTTVTPAPPTSTIPPTEGPCEYQVRQGDSLITLASACGHRSLDVLPAILELNNLSAPEAIQIGQTILIPRPTPTGDPAAADIEPTGEVQGDVAALFVAEAVGTPPTATLLPTSTLLPGIMWHVVLPQESMVAIMYQYNTTAEVLAQINPEIAFSQCDFQYDTGGPACTVLLQPGQQFRVPAPSPTPTLSPTPSGSETATPTATATFNAPSPLSPADRTRFAADQIVTLRWVTTGQLAPGEKYRVTVTNETTGTTHTGDTQDLSFIVPAEWQGIGGEAQTYSWTVGVADSGSGALRYETPARRFIWSTQGTPP